MDAPKVNGGPRPTSEQEIDPHNSHLVVEPNRSEEDGPPSRPSSRLGFNQPPADAPAAAAAGSPGAQWSRSLFQNVGIVDLYPTSTVASSKIDVTAPPTISDEKGPVPFPTTELKVIELLPASACASEDSAKPPAVPRKSPTSVSRLCFPFVTTPSPRRKKPPPAPPPVRHKYSCFPSLLSPVPAGRPSPTHQRHSYRQHGYSRLALQHTKWFWTMREDELTGRKMYIHDGNAYDGISSDQAVTIHSSAQQGSNETPSTSLQPIAPPMTIHPRRGDITALRDPYCMHVDRCFVGLPTWTIGKTLWMHDLHLALERRRSRLYIASDEDDSDGESESEMDTSASTGFGDDSDATLVESESESDLPRLAARSANSLLKEQEVPITSSSTTPAISPLPSPVIGQIEFEKATWSQSVTIKPHQPSDRSNPVWATNWYHRWEVLMDLSRRQSGRQHLQLELLQPSSSFIKGPFGLKRPTVSEGVVDTWDAMLETV